MKSYEIHIEDLKRIFIGEYGPIFLVEVIIRTIFIYLIIMLSMRMMGKRMSSQLGRNEMAAMVSVAAATGVPIQDPDRGLLPIVIISIVIIFFQQIIALRASKNENFEQFSQGNLDILVKDGKMDLKIMRKTEITRERLFAQLRSEGVKNMGKVKRLYLESNGSFSLIENKNKQPGLSVIPDWDTSLRQRQEIAEDYQVCRHCGNLYPNENFNNVQCPNCEKQEWIPAVI